MKKISQLLTISVILLCSSFAYSQKINFVWNQIPHTILSREIKNEHPYSRFVLKTYLGATVFHTIDKSSKAIGIQIDNQGYVGLQFAKAWNKDYMSSGFQTKLSTGTWLNSHRHNREIYIDAVTLYQFMSKLGLNLQGGFGIQYYPDNSAGRQNIWPIAVAPRLEINIGYAV